MHIESRGNNRKGKSPYQSESGSCAESRSVPRKNRDDNCGNQRANRKRRIKKKVEINHGDSLLPSGDGGVREVTKDASGRE